MSEQNKIRFSGLKCFINDSEIDIDLFKAHVANGRIDVVIGKRVIIFELKFDRNYLKIIVAEGSAVPRNPQVYDINKKVEEPNPRDVNQVEPSKFFALFDLSNSYLWVSNLKKKNILFDFFQEKLKNNRIQFKNIYSEEAFIEVLRSLDEIKISAAPDIFNSTNTLTKALTDEMYGAYEAELKLKYNKSFVGKDLKDKIRSIFRDRNNFKSIMISGRDKNDLGILFNNSQISKKIVIEVNIDENGMYDSEDLFNKVIHEIEDEIKTEK